MTWRRVNEKPSVVYGTAAGEGVEKENKWENEFGCV